MEAVSQDVYEAIKAQVLAEQRAERRAKAKAREAEHKEICRMFDPFREKYYLRLVEKYERCKRFQTNLKSPDMLIRGWYREVEDMTLQRMRETAQSVYKSGRAEEANDIASEIMETILQH